MVSCLGKNAKNLNSLVLSIGATLLHSFAMDILIGFWQFILLLGYTNILLFPKAIEQHYEVMVTLQ